MKVNRAAGTDNRDRCLSGGRLGFILILIFALFATSATSQGGNGDQDQGTNGDSPHIKSSRPHPKMQNGRTSRLAHPLNRAEASYLPVPAGAAAGLEAGAELLPLQPITLTMANRQATIAIFFISDTPGRFFTCLSRSRSDYALTQYTPQHKIQLREEYSPKKCNSRNCEFYNV